MRLITKDKQFMNTTITIKVVPVETSTVTSLDLISEAFGEFDRIVKNYTRFNENSELSNLNRQSGSWVTVSNEFLFLIKYMLKLADDTDGAFDPTVIDYLEVYGYDSNYNFSKLSDKNLGRYIERLSKERPSWKEIELDEENGRVKLAERQRIDLGGIGKGFAIDCAHKKLKQDLDNFLIDAGGDIRAEGRNEKDEWWKVALKNINNMNSIEIIGSIELQNESLACSGSWARKVKNFHHLIDPKSGKPENTYKTVYVQAKEAIVADSLATAIFVGGEQLISKTSSDVKIYTIKN